MRQDEAITHAIKKLKKKKKNRAGKISVPSSQFGCELESALKKESLNLKMK